MRRLTPFIAGALLLSACAAGPTVSEDFDEDVPTVEDSLTSITHGNAQEDAEPVISVESDDSEDSAQKDPASSVSEDSPTLTTIPPKTTPPPTTDAVDPPSSDSVPASVENSDFVGGAKDDLAYRLGVSTVAIEVLSVQEVDWPDASAGCPQPDMVYAQVITNGSRIILSHGGITYSYHSAAGGDPFYCADPTDPVPGSEV